jgi:hypothetical protein
MVEKKKSKKGLKTSIVSVRLLPDIKRAMDAMAKRNGCETTSEWLRGHLTSLFANDRVVL